MPRDLAAPMAAALDDEPVRPAWFVAIEFESGWVRVWSGIGSKVWNGETWAGVGDLGSISPAGEPTELRAEGVTLTLSGIPSALVGVTLGDARQGKAAQVWFALLAADGSVIADPAPSFVGRVDVPTIEHRPDGATISITVEGRLIDLERPRERRYTNEDQQAAYPGDLGLEHVAQIASEPFQWGGPARSPVFDGPGRNLFNPRTGGGRGEGRG